MEVETSKTKDNTDIYIEYVTSQIEKLNTYSNLVYDNSINFSDINFALANNLKIVNVLNAEYQRLKKNHIRIKRDFDMWYDEKYIDIRNRENTKDIAGTKWLSSKELDAMTKVENKDEYLERIEKLDALEMRVSFIRRLIDDWRSYMYVLGKLSDNLKTEYFGELKENKVDVKPVGNRIPLNRSENK